MPVFTLSSKGEFCIQNVHFDTSYVLAKDNDTKGDVVGTGRLDNTRRDLNVSCISSPVAVKALISVPSDFRSRWRSSRPYDLQRC